MLPKDAQRLNEMQQTAGELRWMLRSEEFNRRVLKTVENLRQRLCNEAVPEDKRGFMSYRDALFEAYQCLKSVTREQLESDLEKIDIEAAKTLNKR